MKNKILSITIIAIMIAMLIPVITLATTPSTEAENVEIKVVTDKDSYKVGDTVKTTIKWEKEAESFGFLVKYDKEKLEFDSISVGKNFYNAETKGEVLCNWYSADGDGKTNIEIIFKSKVKGSATLEVSNAKGFSWVSDTIDKTKKEYTYIGKTIDITEVASPTPTNPDQPKEEEKPEQKPEEKPNTQTNKTEQPKPTTNTRSRIILVIAESMRKYSGVLLSPTARSTAAYIL